MFHPTIADLAKFTAAASRGWGLSRKSWASTRAASCQSRRISNSRRCFPHRRSTSASTARLRGLGVVTFAGPQGPGFYKGGHDHQTANTMECVKERERCVLILSIDVRAEAVPALVKAALGDTGVPYRWQYPDLYQRPISTSDS